MEDSERTKESLVKELTELRKRIAELEKSEMERRQAEKDLDITSDRLSRAELISRSGNWEFDLLSRRVYASEGARKIYGLSDRIWTIAEVQQIPLPEYRNMLDTALRDLIEEDRPYDVEFKIRRFDTGEIIDIHSAAEYDRGRNVVFGIIQDITERKQTEEALKESEERYRIAIESSNDGVAIVRGDRHVYVNRRFLEMFGYDSPEEILGKPTFLSVHPDDLDTVMDINRRRQRGESVAAKYEFKGIRKDGSILFVEVSATTTTFQGKRVSLAYLRDVTERKNAEESLREREQILKAIIHGSPIPQFVIDNDHKVLYWNQALTGYTGISAGEMVGTADHWKAFYRDRRPCLADLLVGGEISRLQEWYQTKYRSSTLIEGAYEAVDHFVRFGKEPKWLHFTAAAIRDSKGSLVGAVETVVDITELKNAEVALQESEKKYRSIIENAVEGIFQSTPEGRFLSVNPAMATMCGYSSPEEMVAMISDIGAQYYCSPEERLEFLKRLETEGFVQGYEHQIRRKDGSTRWASVSARVVRDTDYNTLYYEGTILDITNHRNLEAQLLQSQKMEAIGTLAGGIAHDFNNILMAMMGYTGLVGMKVSEDPELRSYLNQIQGCTSRAANLTRGLLAFSRKQAVELRPQSTNAILRECEKLLRRLVPEDVDFSLSLDEDVTVMADMTQMDQVLINLVSNAKDAMPKGGILHIEAKAVQLGEEFRRTHGFGEPGRYARISVADTGTGMDEGTQKKMFDPFFTTKEIGKGTGLGLSIVYGIIKQHNGYITVRSKPQEGTTFDIYLPAVKMAIAEEPQVITDVAGGTETILVAEDDPMVRGMVKEILLTYGYNVIEAGDGKDAVSKYVEHHDKIDLLIFDVVMPKKNGKEAYDEICEMDASVPVVFISGYTGDVVINKGIKDTTVGYISKPLSADQLLRKVREALVR